MAELGPLYSIPEVARMLNPSGTNGIKTSSVRNEIRSGRLKSVRFAGKLFVRQTDLEERLQCLDAAPVPNSSPTAPAKTEKSSGTSSGRKMDASAAKARAADRRDFRFGQQAVEQSRRVGRGERDLEAILAGIA